MNMSDILKSGHQTVLKTVEDVPDAIWQQPGACGDWSIKDIIAHLGSFEEVLADILRQLIDENAATPALEHFFSDPSGFNESEVQTRRERAAQTILNEYKIHHAEVMRLMEQISEDRRRRNGILTWYGEAYDLEDFIVYTYYGHKREHCAQILLQRERLEGVQSSSEGDT